MPDSPSDIEASYDRVAAEYAVEFLDELDRKPFDRDVLDRFARAVAGQGSVCEIGCGPGQIARYLKDRGVEIFGVDISAEMIKEARRLHPDIPFIRGDMLHLDITPGSLTGIVCFYAIIHLPREHVPAALKQMNTALRPGGLLLVSFHGGEGTLHRSEWYGKSVDILVTLFTPEEMRRYLLGSSFTVEDMIERPPYPFEYQTQRLYAFARKGVRS